MKLCLSTQNVLGIKGCLDPKLSDIIAVVEEACFFYVSKTVFTSDNILLPLSQWSHVVLVFRFLCCILGLTKEYLGCSKTRC